MDSPALTTTGPIRVYVRYRRRWLKMMLPPGHTFDVVGNAWDALFSPLGTVRCMLRDSGVIADHVQSLDLPFSEWIHDVYVPVRALRASCAPLKTSTEDPGASPGGPALPAALSPATLDSIPDDRRVTSPDGSRVAGWYLASTREDRFDETRVWHVAVFDALSHRLIRWWPHSVHDRHDKGERSGSPISSLSFDPSDPGALLVAYEDGPAQRLQIGS